MRLRCVVANQSRFQSLSLAARSHRLATDEWPVLSPIFPSRSLDVEQSLVLNWIFAVTHQLPSRQLWHSVLRVCYATKLCPTCAVKWPRLASVSWNAALVCIAWCCAAFLSYHFDRNPLAFSTHEIAVAIFACHASEVCYSSPWCLSWAYGQPRLSPHLTTQAMIVWALISQTWSALPCSVLLVPQHYRLHQ